MHFQNESGLFADCAGIICERGFVGGADFTQVRAARSQNFASPKAPTDLHELAARDDDFVFLLSEMANNQNERGCAIVHDGGGFRLTEDGERALEVNAAGAAVAGGKIQLQ